MTINSNQFQQGSTFQDRKINSNPILERIIQEQSAVKKIIYNTIAVRNVRQSSFLQVEDIFQDICILAMDYDKIMNRMGKMYVGNDIGKYFYGAMKMFSIDCVLKEQRHINKFKAKSSKKKLYLNDASNKHFINTQVMVKLVKPWSKAADSAWCKAILVDVDSEFFTVNVIEGWDAGKTIQVKEGDIYQVAIGWADNKKLSHPTFAHRSDTWLTIQQTLTPEDFEIFTLYYSGFTIAEISEKVGKACQYAITKIKKQLADELSIEE